MRIAFKIYALIICLVLPFTTALGQNTVGLIYNEGDAYEGYTLFSPAGNKLVYLIDNNGRIVHQWESTHKPGNAVYLQEDGSLYRAGQIINLDIHAGGGGGIIEKFDWEGDLIWSYTNSDEGSRAHHDFQVLPNGNLLVMIWEVIGLEEVLANGRNPDILTENKLWPEVILEIDPSSGEEGDIVWEWRAWDHLVQDLDDTKLNYGVISDNPGKINLNYVKENKFGADWHHANSINYNADLDQIMISVLNFDEIWIIDHNTTTEEAKGEKGDLIFRWGNPLAYGQGSSEDQMLFGQHNAHWIKNGLPDEGKIMIFNNGKGRPDGEYTSVVKLSPSIMSDGSYEKDSNRFFPSAFDYEYKDEVPTNFYSWYISGVQQLPNGHLLIDDGAHGTFFEIDENEQIVWKYINPVSVAGIIPQGQSAISVANGLPTNGVFRALKYAKDFSAFADKELTPGPHIEQGTILAIDEPNSLKVSMFPNPATDIINIQSTSVINQIQLLNMSGQIIYDQSFSSQNIEIHVAHLANGIYQALLNHKSIGRIIIRH